MMRLLPLLVLTAAPLWISTVFAQHSPSHWNQFRGPNGAGIVDGDCESPSDTELTVYSGRSEDLMAPVFEAFECDTGIQVVGDGTQPGIGASFYNTGPNGEFIVWYTVPTELAGPWN